MEVAPRKGLQIGITTPTLTPILFAVILHRLKKNILHKSKATRKTFYLNN